MRDVELQRKVVRGSNDRNAVIVKWSFYTESKQAAIFCRY